MNKKILKIILTIVIIFIALNLNLAFAGMADFDDNDAKLETNKLLEQQEKEENTIGKSTNNYLSNLEVKGYKITPDFDKQVQEYLISEEIKGDSIEITALVDDSRATVQGVGNVKLKSGENKIRIDVKAESGTIRTYFITVTKIGTQALEENNNDIENEIIDVSAELQEDNNMNSETKNSKNNRSFIIILVSIAIILFVETKKYIKRNSKHRK